MKCSPTISLSAALGFALVLPSRGWAQDYIVRTVSDGGSIAGSVIYAGGAVERSPVNVTTDQGVCGHTPMLSAELIVDPTRNTIQNVVVSIKGISGGKSWSVPEDGLTLDQQGCSFDPHVLGKYLIGDLGDQRDRALRVSRERVPPHPQDWMGGCSLLTAYCSPCNSAATRSTSRHTRSRFPPHSFAISSSV